MEFRLHYGVKAIIDRSTEDSYEFLLIKTNSSQDKWIFPGGSVNPGQSEKELLEYKMSRDLGIILIPRGKVGMICDAAHGDRHTHFSIQSVRFKPGSVIRPRDRVTNFRFFSLTELQREDLSPNTLDSVIFLIGVGYFNNLMNLPVQFNNYGAVIGRNELDSNHVACNYKTSKPDFSLDRVYDFPRPRL